MQACQAPHAASSHSASSHPEDLWYLLGHDTGRDEWRIFRLDRITGVTATGRRVAARQLPGGDPAAFVAERLSAAPTRHRAVATVRAPAEHVRAPTRHLATRIRPLDEVTCLVNASDDSLTRISQIRAGLTADYTLDADPDVLNHLRATAHRTLHATG
ncbi:YafY family protein [Streptomyces sp. SP2-10]|uniref:helix-turn-helix transcriptional regulator n=1 Tax=Streptomyces sp. SP2-10 TaxID=2873385 RepID=UPI00223B6BE2|nr:WYL domain-containing protein [Streptomyces sp. SP2-10]